MVQVKVKAGVRGQRESGRGGVERSRRCERKGARGTIMDVWVVHEGQGGGVSGF